MSIDWSGDQYRAKVVSTRSIQIAGEDTHTKFTREALEGMAAQVRDRFVPITIEHLDYLPPLGRWHDAAVIQASDGEFELETYGVEMRQFVPAGPDPDSPLQRIAELPEMEPPQDIVPVMRVEARNYDAEKISEITATAPFRVREEYRWSELPPIIWTLCIPVVWGACKFTGAFFEALGKESAEAVARWIRAGWNRSKAPDRDRLLSLQFELEPGVYIYGFIPDRHDTSASEMTQALRSAALVASFSGLQRERAVLPGLKRAAFIFDAGEWQLAWWTDGEAVYQTHWFKENMPDPARFLGRPLFNDPPPQASSHG